MSIVLTTPKAGELPAIDLEPLLEFVVNGGHGYGGYGGHGPWMVNAWEQYRDHDIFPAEDTWYYNAGSWYQAWRLSERMGQRDDRFLTYADAECRLMDKAIRRVNVTAYQAMTRGLYLMYQHDPVAYAFAREGINLATSDAINNYGSQSYVNSNATREVARRVDHGRDRYRINDYEADNDYLDLDDPNTAGTRYHRCIRWLGPIEQPRNHNYEWLDMWETEPGYQNAMEYCHDVPNPPTGTPRWSAHSAFMHSFGDESRIYANREDPAYKDNAELRASIVRLVDYDLERAWFPPTGNPGDPDEYGAFAERYAWCYAPSGKRTSLCPSEVLYGLRPTISFDTTGLQLFRLAFAWWATGDRKYIDVADQIYMAFATNLSKRQFYWSAGGGKQFNQWLYAMWAYLAVRGDLPQWYR